MLLIRNSVFRNIDRRFMLSFSLFFYRADNSSQKSHSSGGGGGYPMPQLTDPGGGYYQQQQQQHGANSNGHHSDGASPGSSQLSVDGGRESTLITRTQKQHVTQNVSLNTTVYLCCGSGFFPSRIPDPVVKIVPDPESTLITRTQKQHVTQNVSF
jgi:hypothetical protein